ncbi:hypothetical protein AB0H94_21190 [Streptomyces purpurascens]|uniref:hypothetical protein n=1 Tax=Streptomyces purpurascens TaxID=1924 RepID=UPI0033CBBA8C
MKKVKFTAFATNTKTGKREYGPGEVQVPNYIARENHEESVRRAMKANGYEDLHIDNLTSEC